MKRIVLTVTTDLSFDQRMQRIAAALAEGGYDVWLVGRALPDSPPLQPAPWHQVRLSCRHHKGKLFYLEYNRKLWSLLRQLECDTIAAADLDTLLPAAQVASAKRIPLVFDAHEHFTEVPEVVERPLVRWLWGRVAHYGIPRARLAYTVGPRLADLLARTYRRPFEVVRNVPVFDERLPVRTRPPEPPFVILYQGALNEGRGLECAIEAMTRLPDTFELWLAGEGDRSAALRQKAAASPASARIRFLGKVPPALLRKLTPEAWLGLNLLEHKGLSYYYSLANKAFDYMHAGVPALHPDFPEYRQLVADHGVGLLLERLSPTLLAQTIERLAAQPEQWRTIHQRCLEARRHLNWQQEADHLRALYARLWS